NAGLEVQCRFLRLNWPEHRIEIVEGLAILQGSVIGLGGFNDVLHSHTQFWLYHHVAAKTEKKSAQCRQSLAVNVVAARDAVAKGVVRIHIIDAGLVRAGPGASKANVDVNGTLSAGKRDAKRQYG